MEKSQLKTGKTLEKNKKNKEIDKRGSENISTKS